MIDAEARKAAAVVSSGGIILYPTDTIWGIGCDATNGEAVQRIYEIKQRSDSKSMLVLMARISMLNHYLKRIPEQALEIIRSASKPTTLIYPDARNLAPNLVAADGTIGIRLTTDEFCMKLIGITGIPLVSTSANISGNPAPDSFSAIDPFILRQVDHVVKWRQDETSSPAPSAIIRLDDQGRSTILRP